VQFASAGATSAWNAQPLPSVVLPVGGYFLIQEAAGANTALPFPTPDFAPAAAAAFAMGAAAGKVALTASTTTLTGACPLGLTNDFASYGSGVSCFEGTAGAPAPSNTASVLRANAGCTDTDDNKADFAVSTTTVVPRGTLAGTPVATCGCTP
jgi:hypothetical protein